MRNGWVEHTLGNVVKIVNGGTPSTKNEKFWGGQIVWITTTELTAFDGKKIDASARTITNDGLQNGAAKLVRPGTTLVGTTATIGTCAMADCELTFNQQISGLIPVSSDLNDDYLFYWMQHIKPILEGLSAGTSFKRISTSSLGATFIKIPPLPEQKRIVDLISSVDFYIQALRGQLESIQKSRNAVLHELLTAGSDNWGYKKLSDICEVRDGTHESPKPSTEGFPLVTSKNIKHGRIDLESAYLISPEDYKEVNKRSKVEPFNLLISMIGTIGEVLVVEDEPKFAIKNVGLLKSTDPILSRYLCCFLESQYGKNAIASSVSGSTQKFISLGKLRALPVLYPPRENQKAIVDAMSLFDIQVSRILEVTEKAKNLRYSLLSDLLGGVHEIPSSYDRVMGAA
jgi:type I restriction enzyme S subunit